ncbi:hypothetical protein CSA80_01280 [Candidatus Saccharibacteria bacterium]|nr:MAG: hypothetical protein CSA80_01280 [Candidatus Saccharibacteria bacterium]
MNKTPPSEQAPKALDTQSSTGEDPASLAKFAEEVAAMVAANTPTTQKKGGDSTPEIKQKFIEKGYEI